MRIFHVALIAEVAFMSSISFVCYHFVLSDRHFVSCSAMELQRHPVAVTCLLLGLLLALGTSSPDPSRRQRYIEDEARMRIGGHSQLSPEELQLDAQLTRLMHDEMARPEFLPALHFFKARPLIRSSPIYSLLQKMPKGVQWNSCSVGL